MRGGEGRRGGKELRSIFRLRNNSPKTFHLLQRTLEKKNSKKSAQLSFVTEILMRGGREGKRQIRVLRQKCDFLALSCQKIPRIGENLGVGGGRGRGEGESQVSVFRQ